eukprot:gb/GFBE01025215.1/.p1 GENE.gb/GFBE01025215.1/~~gb/GFBE01025215.1/.p1  ORF type:complete len:704 (+),score=250.32 gb/GFBE01025215.1/:1-2112(+)
MGKIYNMVREQVEDEGQDDELLDFVSEGDDDINKLEPPVQLDSSFPNAVVISGVPKVNQAKFDRLLSVLSKLIDKNGENEKEMPYNAEGTETMGVLFVTFTSPEVAKAAQEALDGMSLDKKHTFKVIMMDEFQRVVDRQDEFVPQQTVSSFSRHDFRDWLKDKKCREQLLLRYQSETEIYWHDTTVGEPVLCYGGEREKRNKKIWCDWKVQWSPLGSYLATFHQQGVLLWGGPEFTRKARFTVKGQQVQQIEFSPNEDFMVTWNGNPALSVPPDEHAVRFFRVLTGECVRSCRTPGFAPLGGEFPHFLWSHDGKYFAECSEHNITVRDSETFEVLKDEDGKKKSFKFPDLATFQWSPKDNVLAVWTLEKDNNPAKLTFIEVPSRRELASRARTQIKASIHWQSEGDYLCLINTKLSKTKKEGATNLEIFRFREKNIPVDVVEAKDNVRGVFWESKGHRIAVLTHDEAGHRPMMFIYELTKEKCEKICEFSMPSNSYNQVYWAPGGQYFVAAALGQGDLLFGGIPDNKLEILHKDEHFMLTDVMWDPSSRYVITAVTQPLQNNSLSSFKYSMEAGYAIWTFQGRLLYRQQKEKLYFVAWRPHPPPILSEKKQLEIKKNIKQYSKRYDAADEKAKDLARNAFKREREEKTSKFMAVLDRLRDYKEDREQENGWDETYAEFMASKGWESVDETIEEQVDVVEEKIQ